ncbi:unnamed protein product [Cylicocyclus nassatus]|uniref:SCP domain-containing protein n=1 Tax=Cylicocyclus nassatus TaxID=53992 RepID=A0AA36M2M3_CYLNA|nr:unnamed protein product [Cylicocyclus nassatus]
MLFPLIVLLQLCTTIRAQVYPCVEGDDFKDTYGALYEQNLLRKHFATRDVKKAAYGSLPGTKNMFKLNYDCTLENFAKATISVDCTQNTRFDSKLLGFGTNFYSEVYIGTAPNDTIIKRYYEFAVDEWSMADSTSPPFGTDMIYKNESAASLANMIYYKTLAVGCAHKYCSERKYISVACVYGAVPEVGQPLYFATVTGKSGCTASTSCRKVVPGSGTTCLLGQPVDEHGNSMDGLCYNKDVHFVEPSTVSQTLPTLGQTVMTDELRNSFLAIHNYRRSSLALGNVRNGAEGNTNCPMAQNMYRMVYDNSLETEAQNYANTCPAGDSDVSTRPNSGRRWPPARRESLSMDASVAAMQAWWSEIFIQHIDFSQPFSRVSAMPVAPTKFTQMAWSATYKLGCGMSRCNSNTQTVVVCRYSPR